ncbi:FAD binding domain-containing protein [Bacillus sp. RG28]|uniref:FAD binding domain-containing protein n=1 Tax=Gottfriedia endophytica TaxID=2820819 RepID=A0A940NJY1_9BACI|nr:FAD binding domain-containing protein [Gottfriedia endophytica]MBP0726684.1 FAD binding domain-containing protein [Gottfriedia endophytica]
MIPFNFQYIKPKTIQEAIEQYNVFKNQEKKPFYMSGGTELITLGRLNVLYTNAVIDLKGIPDYSSMFFHEQYLYIGGGTPLTTIEDSNAFPLLGQTVSEIADRTARNKITLAGNICAQIFYREAVLPLLISDSYIGIAGSEGLIYHPINNIFNEQLQLQDGQFVFAILIEKLYTTLPFVTIKKRRQWYNGYPLVTVAAIKKDQEIRLAISGLCAFPFRSLEMEKVLNDKSLSIEERVKESLGFIPGPVLDDVEGSADYRLFVLKNTMIDIIYELEGDQGGR